MIYKIRLKNGPDRPQVTEADSVLEALQSLSHIEGFADVHPRDVIVKEVGQWRY